MYYQKEEQQQTLWPAAQQVLSDNLRRQHGAEGPGIQICHKLDFKMKVSVAIKYPKLSNKGKR